MTTEPKCPARRRLRREDDLFGPGWHWTHADDYGSLCHQDERCGAKPPPCPGCDRPLDREGENGKWSKRILTLDGVTAVTCRHRLNGQWVDCPGPEKHDWDHGGPRVNDAVVCRRCGAEWVMGAAPDTPCVPRVEKAEPGLVERLRSYAGAGSSGRDRTEHEAADHIEALEAQLAEAKGLIGEMAARPSFTQWGSCMWCGEPPDHADDCPITRARTAGFIEENRDAE